MSTTTGADLTVAIGATLSPSVAKAFAAIDKHTASLARTVGKLDKGLKRVVGVFAAHTRALNANTAALGRTRTTNAQLIQSQNRLATATSALGRAQQRQAQQANAAANAAARLANATNRVGVSQRNTRNTRAGGMGPMPWMLGGAGLGLGATGALGTSFLSGPMEIEQQLQILSTKLTDSSEATMKALKAEALRLGSGASIFNPAEVTKAFVDLAAGGMEKDDILGNAKTIIDIATANQIRDVAEVADLTTNVLTSFYGRQGKSPANVLKFADSIQYVADKTSAGFMDMAWAAKYAAPSFKIAGWSMEDMNAILGVLADNSIKGMDAGTDLQGMVARLASMTSAEKEAMKTMGFTGKNAIFDVKGNLRGPLEVFKALRDVTAKMTSTKKIGLFKELVGQENLKSMGILTDQFDSLLELRTTLNQIPEGTTSQKAVKQMDTLNGKLLQAKGAAAGLASVVYDQLKPTLEKLVSAGTVSLTWLTGFAEAHPHVTKLVAGLALLKGALIGINTAVALRGMLAAFSGPAAATISGSITGAVTRGFSAAWPVVARGFSVLASPTGALGIAAAGMGVALGLLIFEKGIKPAMDKAAAEWEAQFDRLSKLSGNTTSLATVASTAGAPNDARGKAIAALKAEMRTAYGILQEDDRRKATWAAGKPLPVGVRPMDERTRSGVDSRFYLAAAKLRGIQAQQKADALATDILGNKPVDLSETSKGDLARLADALVALRTPESGNVAGKPEIWSSNPPPPPVTITINNNGIALSEVLNMTKEQIVEAVTRAQREQAKSERHSRTGVPGALK